MKSQKIDIIAFYVLAILGPVIYITPYFKKLSILTIVFLALNTVVQVFCCVVRLQITTRMWKLQKSIWIQEGMIEVLEDLAKDTQKA